MQNVKIQIMSSNRILHESSAKDFVVAMSLDRAKQMLADAFDKLPDNDAASWTHIHVTVERGAQ